jgi:hypothetical protein
MFDELHKYKKSGHFFFRKGDNIVEVGKEVPELPGVYYIIRLANGHVELVYIGKSGIKNPSGSNKTSLLKQSITLQQEFLDLKMSETNIDGLDIYWFVTMDIDHIDLPDYVLGLIMQTQYDVYGRLPEWNMGV